MSRHALLIGVSSFTDGRLARLHAPLQDVSKLQGILQDKSRGNFDSVELSQNENYQGMRDRLCRFFANRIPDDLLLLYYSGHGILDRGNRLFLAAADSDLETPRARSIKSEEVRELIEDSRAGRKIVMLDCCHSGAFDEGAKGAPPSAISEKTFATGDELGDSGLGLYVLTASDALQFAWDGDALKTGDEAADGMSKFTSWLVDGLERSEAAPDDEHITMDALYQYVCRRARSTGATSTPQRFVRGGVGDLIITSNPLAGSSQIDAATMSALEDDADRLRRVGAVTALHKRILEGNTVAARGARIALRRRLESDGERDYEVRDQINRALEVAASTVKPNAEPDVSPAISPAISTPAEPTSAAEPRGRDRDVAQATPTARERAREGRDQPEGQRDLRRREPEQPGRPRATAASASPDRARGKTDTGNLPAISGGAGSEKSVLIDHAADEIEQVLERVWRGREVWVAGADEQNSIALSKGASSERDIIEAKADFRDNVLNSKFRALKALGWRKGIDQYVAAGVGSVALYATGGLAAAALLSRKVRDALLAIDASKDWSIANPKQDFPTIALEIQSALKKIAPEARAISLKKQGTADAPPAEGAAGAKAGSHSPAGNVRKGRGEP